jgi:hypothetical protein
VISTSGSFDRRGQPLRRAARSPPAPGRNTSADPGCLGERLKRHHPRHLRLRAAAAGSRPAIEASSTGNAPPEALDQLAHRRSARETRAPSSVADITTIRRSSRRAPLRIERQRQPEVRIECCVRGTRRKSPPQRRSVRGIVEQHPGEHALGHHLDPRPATTPWRTEAAPGRPNRAANLVAQRLRHSPSPTARAAMPPRLQHRRSCPSPRPRLARSAAPAARASSCPPPAAPPARRKRTSRERTRQVGKDGIDGEGRKGHARRLRFLHPVRKRDRPEWHATRVRALPLRCTAQGPPDVPERDGGVPCRDVDASRHQTRP